MEPFKKIDAKDIDIKSTDVRRFIQQMVEFHASRIDKDKIVSSLDIVNDFLRIMEPLRNDMDYWINFFTDWKTKLNEHYAKINKVEGGQVSFFDVDDEKSL